MLLAKRISIDAHVIDDPAKVLTMPTVCWELVVGLGFRTMGGPLRKGVHSSWV